MEECVTGELRQRGEITIPKKIRARLGLESGQQMNFLVLGEDTVLLTPKRLELNEARRQIQKILQQTGASAHRVLAHIAEDRGLVFKKHYPGKS